MAGRFLDNATQQMIRASVDMAPDGNLWVTVRDADTDCILRPPSGPYTDARHFLDVCRMFPITRIAAEELHAVATRTGHCMTAPIRLVAPLDYPPDF